MNPPTLLENPAYPDVYCVECSYGYRGGWSIPAEPRAQQFQSLWLDGGSLGRGSGPTHYAGSIQWIFFPEFRCPCRIAAEKRWAFEALDHELAAWEACSGHRTVSPHSPDPVEVDDGYRCYDDADYE